MPGKAASGWSFLISKPTIVSSGNVATDLYQSIQSERARQAELDFRKTIDSLTAEDVATAVAYAIETPV